MLGSGAGVVDGRSRCGLKKSSHEGAKSVFSVPWWLLSACLVVSALVAYLLLERTQGLATPHGLSIL
jgi:type VI protein secretion system component VasF